MKEAGSGLLLFFALAQVMIGYIFELYFLPANHEPDFLLSEICVEEKQVSIKTINFCWYGLFKHKLQ